MTTHTIIYVGYSITKQEKINLLTNRYMETLFKIRNNNGTRREQNATQSFPHPFFSTLSKEKLESYLTPYNLSVPTISYEKLKKKGDILSMNTHWELYEYEGYTYFYRDDKFDSLFIKDKVKVSDKTLYFVLLTLLLNSTFLLFYLFLLKKLSPLKRLKDNISRFSQGDLDIDTSTQGKDEISAVSNEFNNAIIEIRDLTESRNLFLRNIMHELKTPITKGKLICRLMKNEEHKKLLQKVFEREEYLLLEFAKIEQLTSKNIELNKKKYRLVDIIDQALDMQMISKENIIFDIHDNLFVEVDFYLFAIVIKNLIDNGLKYSNSNITITLNQNYFALQTEGKKLEKDLSEYLKPFNRDYETTTQSLGLGLYIVGKILKLHQLKLEYIYKETHNIFYIQFH